MFRIFLVFVEKFSKESSETQAFDALSIILGGPQDSSFVDYWNKAMHSDFAWGFSKFQSEAAELGLLKIETFKWV